MSEAQTQNVEHLPVIQPRGKDAGLIVTDASDFSNLLDTAKFEHMWRVATVFAGSKLVPKQYQNDRNSCFVALQMAVRLEVDPFMFMQNTYLSPDGKPALYGQLAIALVNARGPFKGPIQYRFEGEGDERQCVAFAVHKQTGETCEMPVSIAMAKAEGWYGRNPKWRNIPDLMLRYRAGAWLGRVYAPECLMGLPTQEELEDVQRLERGADGVHVPVPARPRRSDFQAEHPGLTPTAAEAATADEPDETWELYDEHGELRGPYHAGMWTSSLRDLLYRGHRPTAACRQIVENNLEAARAVIGSGRIDGATWEAFETEMINAGFMDNPDEVERRAQQEAARAAEAEAAQPDEGQPAEPVTYPYRHSSGQLIVDCQTAKQFVDSLEGGMEPNAAAKNAELWRANRPTVMQIVEHDSELAERLMDIQSRFVIVKPAAGKGKK